MAPFAIPARPSSESVDSTPLGPSITLSIHRCLQDFLATALSTCVCRLRRRPHRRRNLSEGIEQREKIAREIEDLNHSNRELTYDTCSDCRVR